MKSRQAYAARASSFPGQAAAERKGREEARTDNIEYIGSARKAMVAATDSTLMPTATKRRPAWLHMLRHQLRRGG